MHTMVQRRRVRRAQIAHRLRHPIVTRIGERRKDHCRRVGKKADDTQQTQFLNQRFLHLISLPSDGFAFAVLVCTIR